MPGCSRGPAPGPADRTGSNQCRIRVGTCSQAGASRMCHSSYNRDCRRNTCRDCRGRRPPCGLRGWEVSGYWAAGAVATQSGSRCAVRLHREPPTARSQLGTSGGRRAGDGRRGPQTGLVSAREQRPCGCHAAAEWACAAAGRRCRRVPVQWHWSRGDAAVDTAPPGSADWTPARCSPIGLSGARRPGPRVARAGPAERNVEGDRAAAAPAEARSRRNAWLSRLVPSPGGRGWERMQTVLRFREGTRPLRAGRRERRGDGSQWVVPRADGRPCPQPRRPSDVAPSLSPLSQSWKATGSSARRSPESAQCLE